MSRKISQAEMDELMTYILEKDPIRKYMPGITPFDKQLQVIRSKKPEILFGGSVGGSKSFTGFFAALSGVNHPQYKCMVMRRSFSDLSLPGCLIDISKQYLTGTDARWNGSNYSWTFPSGAQIVFGYLDNDRDKFRYKSSAFTTIIIDESTEIHEDSITYMMTRLRVPVDSGLTTRLILLTNPGGVSHQWHVDRFLKEKHPDREFIPSTRYDNPYIDHIQYDRNLAQLDAITYAQLAEGKWIQAEDRQVYRYSGKNAVTGSAPVCDHYVIGVDLGYVDDVGIVIMGWNDTEDIVHVISAERLNKCLINVLADKLRTYEEEYNPDVIVVDSAGAGKMITETLSQTYGLAAEAAEKKDKEGTIKLLNAYFEQSKIRIYDGCGALTEEWQLIQRDKYGKVKDGNDHCADAALYAFRSCKSFFDTPETPKLTKDQVYIKQIEAQEERLIYHQDEPDEMWL